MDTSGTLIILHKSNDDLALNLQRNSAIKGSCTPTKLIGSTSGDSGSVHIGKALLF